MAERCDVWIIEKGDKQTTPNGVALWTFYLGHRIFTDTMNFLRSFVRYVRNRVPGDMTMAMFSTAENVSAWLIVFGYLEYSMIEPEIRPRVNIRDNDNRNLVIVMSADRKIEHVYWEVYLIEHKPFETVDEVLEYIEKNNIQPRYAVGVDRDSVYVGKVGEVY